MRPAWPMRRRNLADLTRYQAQTAAVEAAAQRCGDRLLAVPAQFNDRCFLSCECDGYIEAAGGAARVKDDVAIAFCGIGRRKTDAEPLCQLGTKAVRVDERHVGARKVAAEERDQRTDRAGPHDRNPASRARRRVPYGVERRFHVRCKN